VAMKDIRWKSLSIMDLHLLKRGSLAQSSEASEAAGARNRFYETPISAENFSDKY
jgi:hypothetical protein